MAQVDFLRNRHDLQVLILGELGFSTAFIESRTGLTPCQVTYRLGRRGVRRATYRNGGGAAIFVLSAAERHIARQVRDSLASGNGKPKKKRRRS
jgi:hypothetical protein